MFYFQTTTIPSRFGRRAPSRRLTPRMACANTAGWLNPYLRPRVQGLRDGVLRRRLLPTRPGLGGWEGLQLPGAQLLRLRQVYGPARLGQWVRQDMRQVQVPNPPSAGTTGAQPP
eukprot:scaffold18549_cov99-Isochrysis_galbana.AAC.2